MIKKILILLLCSTLLPVYVSAKTVEIDLTRKTTGNAVVRSILIPGWGQFFNGKPTKGYIILIGAVVSAAVAYYYYYESEKSYNIYKTIGLTSDPSYNDYVSKSNNSQYALLALGVFWLCGIVDASFNSFPKGNTERTGFSKVDKKDGLRLAFDKKGLKLVLGKTF